MANVVLFYMNVISGSTKSWVFLHLGWTGVHLNLQVYKCVCGLSEGSMFFLPIAIHSDVLRRAYRKTSGKSLISSLLFLLGTSG